MAKEFIVYSKTKAEFEALVSSGEVDTSQMGIIAETGEMWWNGEYRLIAETVPFANDLTGRIEATPEEFTFRPSAGDKSIRDESALIKKIKGNTIVWNQIGTFRGSRTLNGLTITNENNILRVSGTLTEALQFDILPLTAYLPQGLKRDGRKYLISLNAPDGVAYGINGYSIVNTKPYFWSATAASVFYGYISIKVYVGTTVDYVFSNPQIIDLTQMFGAGNEPTTVDEFKALFPNGYYDYNAGELVSMTSNGLFANGFNQFNGEYAEVLPNNTYYLSGTYTTIGFTEEIGGTLEDITIPTDKLYTPTKKGYIYATGTNININLSHTGVRNGEYEPYWDATKDLSIIQKYFPNGMRSAGSICDEISFDESTQKWVAIKRVGSVDLGNSDIKYDSTRTAFYLRLYNSKTLGKAISPKFTLHNVSATDLSDGEMSLHSTYYLNSVIFKATSYTDATSFKTAMSGVMLYYELAEPIITTIEEPIDLSYKVGDFGIEKMLSDSFSTPFKADIIYKFNATDRVRENSMNIAKLSKKQILLESDVDALETEVETLNTDITSSKIAIANGGVATAASITKGGTTILDLHTLYTSYLSWAGKALSGTISPVDGAYNDALRGNPLAFGKSDGVIIEYSRDAETTWVDYEATDEQKISLISGITQTIYIGKRNIGQTVDDRVRITLTAPDLGVYCESRRLLVNINTTYSTGCYVDVSLVNYNGVTSTPVRYSISGWPGWNSIPLTTIFGSNSWSTKKIVLTFGCTGIDSTKTGLSVRNIHMISGNKWNANSNMSMYGRDYSIDYLQNVTFPATVQATDFKTTNGGIGLTTDAQTLTANQKAQVATNLGGNTDNGLVRYVGGVLPLRKISAPDANGVEQTYVLPNASDEDKENANGIIATEGFVDEGYVPRPSGTSASKANKLLAYSEGRTYDSGVGIAQQTRDIASGATDSVPTSAQVKEYISSIAGPRLAYSENLLGVAVDKEYFDVSNAQKVALSTTAKAILYAAKTLTDVVTVDANGIPTTNRISLADSIIEDNQFRYALPSAPEQSLGGADEVLATERYVQTYMVDNLPKEVATATQRITALPSTNVLPPNVIVDLAMESLANTISISGLGSGGRDFSYDNVWRLRFAGTSSILSISSSLTIYWENGVAPNFTEWAICDIEFREVPNGSIIGKWTIYR